MTLYDLANRFTRRLNFGDVDEGGLVIPHEARQADGTPAKNPLRQVVLCRTIADALILFRYDGIGINDELTPTEAKRFTGRIRFGLALEEMSLRSLETTPKRRALVRLLCKEIDRVLPELENDITAHG